MLRNLITCEYLLYLDKINPFKFQGRISCQHPGHGTTTQVYCYKSSANSIDTWISVLIEVEEQTYQWKVLCGLSIYWDKAFKLYRGGLASFCWPVDNGSWS